jgi:uncharacterized protein (DUF58 family)
MLKQRDSVGLVIFDQKIRRFIPPRSVFSYLNVILQELQNTECRSTTNVANTFHQLAERINRRGLVMIFSDLLDDPNAILSGLKHFRHKKHEVIVFHILDPYETNFDFNQDATFVDMENSQKLSTQPWHIRKEYRDLVNQFMHNFKKNCLENRIDYVSMNTQDNFERALLQYLIKRKKIGG